MNTKNTKASLTPAPTSKKQLARAENLALAVGLAGLLWLPACVASSMWLGWQVPLTETDLQLTSWLGSPTTALHFGGAFGIAMGVTMLLMGAAVGVARGTPLPFVSALMLAVAFWSGGEAHLVRVGLLEGHIKLGCYIYESRECHSMLGLSTSNAPSRYKALVGQPGGGEDAKWYQARRKQVVPAALELKAALHSTPGISFLLAPLYVGRGHELNALLTRQRQEAMAVRNGDQPMQHADNPS